MEPITAPFSLPSLNLLSDPAFKVYAVCTVILFYKMFGIAFYQTINRTKTKTFTNPEDAAAFKGNIADKEMPEVDKAFKAFRNDLENIPMFLFLGLVYVLLGCSATGAYVSFSLFTLSRISHTVCYIKGIQPFRTMSFGIGFLCSVYISLCILYKILF